MNDIKKNKTHKYFKAKTLGHKVLIGNTETY